MSTYVTVTLAAHAATAPEVSLINSYAGGLGGVATTASIVMPFQGIFQPPANARLCEILTPGAYFFPPGETTHSDRTLQHRDPIATVDASVNATLAIYAYLDTSVLVRVDF